MPSVLTIAGSDSGGGAGIQADLRTFNALKVYGCSAITAVTAQNPFEVRGVEILSAEAVKSQLETILDAIPVHFAKSGMLASRKIISVVAETVAARKLDLVIDPVMVSTSGVRLLELSAVESMIKLLFPLAKWITPNIPEAELICGKKLECFSDLADAALLLYKQYNCNIIIKGGHFFNSDCASDAVCHAGKLFILSSPWLDVSGNTTHGTGCTFSAALTANLALNKSWELAVREAKAFVYGSLAGKVALSNKLSQMYPPEESLIEKISLIEC